MEQIPIFVLILIILEYIYMTNVEKFACATKCLNPYYTGIHLHHFKNGTVEKEEVVLILIILEYIYIN